MVTGRWIETGGDLWMDRARSLQLRLRNRLRVAVDRKRLTMDDYFSSTVQRWTQRLRDFRRESLPSSTTFYRRRVSKDIDPEADSVLTRMLQAVAVPIIGNVCHVFMHGLNRVQIYGAEKLNQVLMHRPDNKPLITVSNHVASMDDPLVIAALLPPSVLLQAHSLRWTLCATDRCFSNPVTSAFFKYVKVLPVSRGEGIYQKGMDMAIAKLNRGGWVHIFPEGSRSRDGGKTIGSTKRGIGRLVLDADDVPIVVPFVHNGMHEIMPIGAKVPRVGKTVTVLVGDPIEFDDLLDAEENKNISRGKLYDAVSARIGDRLQKLKGQVDKLVAEQSQDYLVAERASVMLHQVDWESLGMESYVGTDIQYLQPKLDFPAEPREVEIRQQENNTQDPYSARFSFGGISSRIRGYMDSTELMLFAARGLFMNNNVQDNIAVIQEVEPLKALNNIWRSMYANQRVPFGLNYAAAT